MKMTMDLLPLQYKCLPRSYKAIAVLVILLIAIPSVFFGLKYYFAYRIKAMGEVNEAEMKDVEENINRITSEIAELENKLKTPRLSRDKIIEINERIAFFNRIYQKSFSWYDLFDKIEKLTPQGVYIKEIKIKGESLEEQEFKIICESQDSFLAPEFLKNLMENKEFVPPTKDQNSVVLSEVVRNPAFGYEFSLTFKFYPFKSITIDPERIVMRVGDKKELRIFVVNIMEQKRELWPGNYTAEVVNLDGNATFSEADGTLRALKEGRGFIKITTLDKKFSITGNFDIIK